MSFTHTSGVSGSISGSTSGSEKLPSEFSASLSFDLLASSSHHESTSALGSSIFPSSTLSSSFMVSSSSFRMSSSSNSSLEFSDGVGSLVGRELGGPKGELGDSRFGPEVGGCSGFLCGLKPLGALGEGGSFTMKGVLVVFVELLYRAALFVPGYAVLR